MTGLGALVARARSTGSFVLRASLWCLPVAFMLWQSWTFAWPLQDVSGDFYPVHWGALSWLQHRDAYDFSWLPVPAGWAESVRWQVGNVYPLPTTLLLGLPTAALPPMVAALVTTYASIAVIIWLSHRNGLGPVLLWWLPILESVWILQVESTSVCGYLLLWTARRERRTNWAAAAVLLLSWKPHAGLAGIIMAVYWFRRDAVRLLAPSVACWAASLAMQPDWVLRWAQHVVGRQSMMHHPWHYVLLLPLPLIVGYAARGASGIARDGLMLSAATIAGSLLAPWPLPAWYPAASWLVGIPRATAAIAVLPPIALLLWVPPPVAAGTGVALAIASLLRDRRSGYQVAMMASDSARSAG